MKTARLQQRPRYAAWILLTAYSAFMIYLLFFGFSRSNRSGRMYNLVPFKTITNYIREFHHFQFDIWVINLFGNVAAFIPFGLLVPLLLPRFSGGLRLTGLFLLLLFAVEATQLLGKVGSFDVDDILLNVLGIWIGRLLFSALMLLGLVNEGRK